MAKLTGLERAYLTEEIQERFVPLTGSEPTPLQIHMRLIVADVVRATIDQMELDRP